MSRGTIAVLADTGREVGTGHLSRCLALSERWVAGGGAAVVLAARADGAVSARADAAGVELRIDPTATVDTLAGVVRERGAAWAVLDGYRFGRSAADALQAAGARAVVVDDHAHVLPAVADVVVDQNVGADAAPYRQACAGAIVLAGPQHAILRGEFLARRDKRHACTARAAGDDVLVTLGGAPAAELVTGVVRAVVAAGVPADAIVVAGAVDAAQLPEGVRAGARDDMAEVMAGSRFAVAAGGTTALELCFMGVPAALVSIAANQEPVVDAMAAAGAAVGLGRLGELEPAALVATVAGVLGDDDRLAAMRAQGAALVDGWGVDRIVAELALPSLQLRPVEPADARMLWEWANDPGVRRWSFNRDPIPWEAHFAWFESRLRDPLTTMLVMEHDGVAGGLVRFQVEGDGAEVGINLAAAARGRHLAAPTIRAATRRLLAGAPRVERVVARVKRDNEASRRAFFAAGYVAAGPGEVDGEPIDVFATDRGTLGGT